jgi:hypothetical protein
MDEVLTVCRLGNDWAVKDSRGSYTCRSIDREKVEAYAKALAALIGGSYIVRDEPSTKRPSDRASGEVVAAKHRQLRVES